MPKKLVIVTDAWLPQVNGVVTSLNKTKEILEGRGFSVTVIHPGMFFTLPLPFYPEIRLSFTSKQKLEGIISTIDPDFIHIATEGPLGFLTRMLCLRKKWKFTTSYHTHFPHYIKVRIGILFHAAYSYLCWFHNAGESTMVATEGLRSELEKHGMKRIVLWPLGVDTELFKPGDRSTPSQFTSPVFVYFGRIAKEKNIEEFLKCDLPGTKLVIGDGPQKKSFEQTYADSAVFIGYKKGRELVDALKQCDVFVFPSRTDTFGLVIIEALAMGIPVAAHNVLGPRDIISDGIDGVLDEDLARAAMACLSLSREKCRTKALSYSWERSADAFIANLTPSVQ